MQRFRKWLISKLFTKDERGLIIDAVCDYTDYPDDVVEDAEHYQIDWHKQQELDATNIVNKVNFKEA